MSKLVTATFKTRDAAFRTITELEEIGISEEQVGLLVTDETRGKTFAIETGDKVDEGTAMGGIGGGVLGAVVAAVASGGAIAIPGLNLVVSGVLISTLTGLGAGAAAGGLVGALVGAGYTEHEAKLYEDEIKKGGILLAVEAKDSEQKEKVKDILERDDAYNLAA